MKVLRHKNLFGILFAVLLCLPMFSILGRTAYSVVNKNAYQSYSDYVDSNNTKLTNGDIAYAGQLITFTSSNPSTLVNGQLFYVYNNQTNLKVAFGLSGTYSIERINFIYETGRIRIQFFETDTGIQHNVFRQLTDYWSFWIVNQNDVTIGNADYYYNVFVTTYSVGTLDNAFEYSVNKVIDNNNFGELDFFEWFTDMFLDSSNTTNAMYVHFINWYLNYALLISLAYILFLVLMWFINYIRRLLDKGMNIGNGSY